MSSLLFETSDRRVVCGFRCTWWDDIGKAAPIPNQRGSHGRPLPGCPHCHSPLLVVDSPDVWWQTVLDYQNREVIPGYVEYVWWLKGRCYPSARDAASAYREMTGKTVRLPDI